MSFIDICWLIVKICAGLIVLFLVLGFSAKAIANRRARKEIENEHDFPTHD